MIARLLLALALLLSPLPLAAQSSAQLPHTRVELVAETSRPAPGKPFTVGIVMTPIPGWHTYWKNPGDSGMETRATWTLPAGGTASSFAYPVPKTYLVAGLMNHVYDRRNVLLAEVRLPAFGEAAAIGVKLDWLVCNEALCVPESATLSIPIRAGDGAPDPANARLFADARTALPRPAPAGATYARRGDRVQIAVPVADAGGVTAAHFFPLTEDSVTAAAPQVVGRAGDRLVVEAQAAANPVATGTLVEGVLRIERGGRVEGVEVRASSGAVPAATPLPARDAAGGTGAPGLLAAFLLALAGGLVLNVMPCVFPILSLKAMSLARSGETAGAARVEALAYTAGVLAVIVALGGAAIALAQAGGGAGWAAQLQDPRIILALMLLTLSIGLNFAGLFEVDVGGRGLGQSLTQRAGWQGAFFTGGLAAFVATPCTGPFMAGALGAALVLPPAQGLLVFVGLGLGLALPFLLIGFVPALRRRLPRPGPWMGTFRRILAVPMLLTALALAWVLGRQAGSDGLALGLTAALGVALGLWWLGLRQARPAASRAGTLVPLGLAAAAAIIGPPTLPQVAQAQATQTAEAPGRLQTVAFAPDRLAELRAAAKPTFLYFTADWCLTCKVNERGALASPEVAAAFERAGVQVMVGDWTRPDPAIARFLAEHRRAGIPFYLFYRADGSIEELPQILTEDRLLSLVDGGVGNRSLA